MSDSTHPITEAIALRIGLAARALPDIEPARLVQVVLDLTGGAPPTPLSLQGLTVRRLKEALDGALSDQPTEQLKAAVAYLRGEAKVTEIAADLPQPKPYAEGEMPGAIRVALASNAAETLDGHFGTCARFLVYQVNTAEARLIDVRRAETGRTETMDKNDLRAEQVKDCQMLYVVSIGGPAAAKVVRRAIHPVKRPEGGEAQAVLAELRAALKSPPPWLAKVMGLVYAPTWGGADD